MQSDAWKFALARVPREHHPIMMIVTTIGIEINVNTIQRLEDDYAVLRGRLGGTTEAGRVFFVPYDQINYITFTREMKEDQVQQLLGLDDVPKVEAPAPPVEAPAPVEAAKLEPSVLPPPPPPPVTSPPAKASASSKFALLERIRMRNKPKPPPEEPPAPNK
jgi:hypothetical protein